MQSEMPAPGSYEPFRLKEKIGGNDEVRQAADQEF